MYKLKVYGFYPTEEYLNTLKWNQIAIVTQDNAYDALERILSYCDLIELVDLDFYQEYIDENGNWDDLEEFLDYSDYSQIVDLILDQGLSEDNSLLNYFLNSSNYKIKQVLGSFVIYPRDKEDLALLMSNPSNCYILCLFEDNLCISRHEIWVRVLKDEDINEALIKIGYENLIDQVELFIQESDTMNLKAFDNLSYKVHY